MRIAMIGPFGLRPKGTMSVRALPLARALVTRGHAVRMVLPPWDYPQDAGCTMQEAGVAIENIELPAGLPGLFHLTTTRRLVRRALDFQPDVIHCFKPKAYAGLAAWWLWQLKRMGRVKARLIVDTDDWEGAGGWNDDPRAGYSALQRPFFTWQERYGLSHADAWTVTSECLRQRAIGFGAHPDRIFTVHNGAEMASNQLSATPALAPERSAGAVASDRPSAIGDPPSAVLYTRFAGTRSADVAAIWARVRERVPGAKLTVVGHGLGGEESGLVGLPGITVQGWVEPTELPDLLRRMAVGIVPWVDTPSNQARHSAKVLELMAAGLPIVAYAVGELPATLGEAGILVPPGDADGFAAAVAALLAEPGRATRLGIAAQGRVQTHFTWERLADVALAAYHAASGG